MRRAEIITLGCRLNIYESEKMRHLAQQHGIDDAVIINSCAVTAQAQRQSRQAIRRARRDYPARRIFATGCAAEIAMPEFAAMKEIDGIIRNADKIKSETFLALSKNQDSSKSPAPPAPPAPYAGKQSRTRAMLKIQDGCDWHCTFCVIPQGRGKSRSRHSEDIISEARALFEAGHREITLTGVDISSYGKDLSCETSLGVLAERILAATPSDFKLRLSSLDPAAIDSALLSLLCSEPRLHPHIHLSVQSGDNLILKRMRRRHSREDVIALCDGLRKKRAISIGADFIAGFPTETPAMFARTRDLIDECDIIFAHVFPFSPRRGTPAALMPQTAPKIASERAHQLREAAQIRLSDFLTSQIGRRFAVLAETPQTGRAPFYAAVRWHSPPLQAGRVYMMEAIGAAKNTLIAVPSAAPAGSARGL